MKICVVGGTGNISSSIVNLLLKQNHEIVCFNRGIRNTLPNGVRLIKGDRSDTENFEKTIPNVSTIGEETKFEKFEFL